MKPYRIGYLSPQATLGGAERAVELLIDHHDRKRFEPRVLFLRDGPLIAEFGARIPTRLIPPIRLRHFWKWPSLEAAVAKWLRDEKIDLLHNTMTYGHVVGAPAAKWVGTPTVWFQHGPIGGHLDRVASILPARRILVNSEFTRTEQEKLNLLKIPITTVYSGVRRPAQFDQVYQARDKLRSHWGFEKTDFVVGHLARLQRWKGQIEFVEAFALAQKKHPNLKALIVGSSDLGSKSDEADIHNRIQKLKLTKSCIMTGFTQNIDEAYACFDLFVHSSIQPEPLGLTYIEAMARSIPVITSPQGGPGEIVQDDVCGRLVEPTNSQALSEAISEILTNPDLRKKYIEAGKKRAAMFSAENFTARVERVYEEILQEPKQQ